MLAESWDRHGIGILLTAHDMGVVMRVSDRQIVLDHGRKTGVGSSTEVRADPTVIRAYLGSEVDAIAITGVPVGAASSQTS